MTKLKMRLYAPDWLNTDYLSHVDERSFLSRELDKCLCERHLELKLDCINRTKLLRDHLKATYFKDKLLECGGDCQKKWKLIRKF